MLNIQQQLRNMIQIQEQINRPYPMTQSHIRSPPQQPIQTPCSDYKEVGPITAIHSVDTIDYKCSKLYPHLITKRLLSRATASEELKENILRIRCSRRREQLKELTENNIQMFLRIRAQQSHYQFKPLHRQMSCQMLQGPKNDSSVDNSSRMKPKFRCESAKSHLLSRCNSMKRSIGKDKREYQSNQLGLQVETSDSSSSQKKIRILRKWSGNKENQRSNGIRNIAFQNVNISEVQNKIIAQKLGKIVFASEKDDIKRKKLCNPAIIIKRSKGAESVKEKENENENEKDKCIENGIKKVLGRDQATFFQIYKRGGKNC